MDSEFLRVQRDVEETERKPRSGHPTGWEPKLVVDGAKAELVSRAVSRDEPAPGWEDELRSRGGDPTRWKPSGPVRFSSWDAQVKGGDVVQMHAYRWNLVPVGEDDDGVNLDELIREVKRSKKKSPENHGGTERAFVVCLSDWQAGKPEGGGVEALIQRLETLREAVPHRVRQLKKAGVPIDRLYIATMGDLVEGCDGHYPAQPFGVELTRRQQETLVRRQLVAMVTEWSQLAPKVVVAAVPGNHGENRRDGKMFTSFEDNGDLAVVEQLGEILAANPESFGHVRVVLADGDMTLTLDVAGKVVGFAHGHQARGSGTAQQKIGRWWEAKMKAQHRIGDADILVTGHYHHLVLVQDGPRTHMQCPANDGGSRWFEEQGGPETLCGTLSFTVDAGGWANLELIR